MGGVIGPLLPAERGRGCRPAQDNRRFFEGMVAGAHRRPVAASARQLAASGTASSAAIGAGGGGRLRRHAGEPADLVERDPSADMIDSTIVRAHHCAVGIKRGLRKPRRLARSRGGFTTKLHTHCDARAARSASS